MNDPFNQELPHKDEAERTVLGAMLQSRTAIDEARQKSRKTTSTSRTTKRFIV